MENSGESCELLKFSDFGRLECSLSNHQSILLSFVQTVLHFLQRLSCRKQPKSILNQVLPGEALDKPGEALDNPGEALDTQRVLFSAVPIGGSFQLDNQTLHKVSDELAAVVRLASGDFPKRRRLLRFDQHRLVTMLRRRAQDRT